jgi:hypothetical protein
MVLAIGALSCSDRHGTLPTESDKPGALPPTGRRYLEASSSEITPTSTNWVYFATYPPGTLALVSVSGLVNVDKQVGSYQTDYRGVMWGGGCYEGMQLYTSNGASLIAGGNCPGAQGEIGGQFGFATYALVGNQTYARWSGGVPNSGATYSGSFTVLITPVPGFLRTTGSAYTVVRGTTVRFTAEAIPASIGGKVMPKQIAWRYVTDGGQTVYPCGPWSPCDYAPTSSGVMYIEGSVNNVPATASEAISVIDSLPPLPPDTSGGGESGGGGGGGEGGGGGGGSPAIHVACVGDISGTSTVIRGDEAICNITMTGGGPAVIQALEAVTLDGTHAVRLSPPNTTTPAAWAGTMIASTKVTVKGTYAGRALSDSMTITVVPRTSTWTAKTQVDSVVWSYSIGPRMSIYPSPTSSGSAGVRFGAFTPDIELNAAAESILSGPNRGAIFFREHPSIWAVLNIHPALSPTVADSSQLWYNDQNGQGSGTCTSQNIAFLHQEVRRHEGVPPVAPNSHVGRFNALLATQTFSPILEAMFGSNPTIVSRQAAAALNPFFNALSAQETAWDLVDSPAILNAMGCTLDYSLTDGG